MEMHTCNPGHLEAKAGGAQVQGPPGQLNESLWLLRVEHVGSVSSTEKTRKRQREGNATICTVCRQLLAKPFRGDRT